MLKVLNFFSRAKKIFKNDNPIAIARWCIQQFCTCPHCDKEFDVIQTNLKRGSNQGTITINQKLVSRYDKDKFDYEEITATIPTPPYFGAMMQDTENLDEHIDCPHCNHEIIIQECRWGFGK